MSSRGMFQARKGLKMLEDCKLPSLGMFQALAGLKHAALAPYGPIAGVCVRGRGRPKFLPRTIFALLFRGCFRFSSENK